MQKQVSDFAQKLQTLQEDNSNDIKKADQIMGLKVEGVREELVCLINLKHNRWEEQLGQVDKNWEEKMKKDFLLEQEEISK